MPLPMVAGDLKLPQVVQDMLQEQVMPMMAKAKIMGVDPRITSSDPVNGQWLFDASRTRMIFPGRPHYHQLRHGPVGEEPKLDLSRMPRTLKQVSAAPACLRFF